MVRTQTASHIETEKVRSDCEPFFVIPARLERATHSLEGCCSIQLSYGTSTYLHLSA